MIKPSNQIKGLVMTEITTGVQCIHLPDGKTFRILIIQDTDILTKKLPSGWYYSLESAQDRVFGPYRDANAAFAGALKEWAPEIMKELNPDLTDLTIESIEVMAFDQTINTDIAPKPTMH